MVIFDLANLAYLIDYNFSQIKDEIYAMYPVEYTKYMKFETMTRPFEKRSYISGLGFPVKNRDAEPIPFDAPVPGYQSEFVPVNYRLGYQIDRTSIEDEKWNLLADRPRTMVRGSNVIRDMVAADILNNGFTSQAYDFGGTPLFSESQVREDGQATWSNLINEDQPITVETVFEAISSLLVLMEDSRGMPINFTGTVNIYVPMSSARLWQQAVEVANSIMNPNTADNKINALKQQFPIQVIPLRYLTDPDKWFIGWDPSMPNYGLVFMERSALDISPLKPFGQNEDVWYSRSRQRFTAGYDNKRGIAAVGAV